jgi:hypothetical protein
MRSRRHETYPWPVRQELLQKGIAGTGRTEGEGTAFLYLVPRVLKRAPGKDEIEAWRPWLMRQLQLLNPEMVVALGKLAGEAMGELADLTMTLMPPSSTETRRVFRKASMLREALSTQGTDYGCDGGLLGMRISEGVKNSIDIFFA